MNIKYYVRGLGAGLIIAAATMMITGAVSGENTSKESTTQPTTASSSIIAYTTAAETKEEEKTTETQTETTAVETTAQQQTTTVEATTQVKTEATTEAKTETALVNSDGSVQIVIHNVYYATQAAAILYDAGVITDKQEFNEYMMKSGYASKIKEGVYSVMPGATYETIARIITQN